MATTFVGSPASSCFLEAYWDTGTTRSSRQQVYRFRLPVVADPDDLSTFTYPFSSVITRNRILGRGRTLKLRFESETGKDFQLEGYEVWNARNQGF